MTEKVNGQDSDTTQGRRISVTHPLADGVSPKSYESRRAEFASTVHASDANYNVATGNAFARTEGITTFTVVGS